MGRRVLVIMVSVLESAIPVGDLLAKTSLVSAAEVHRHLGAARSKSANPAATRVADPPCGVCPIALTRVAP